MNTPSHQVANATWILILGEIGACLTFFGLFQTPEQAPIYYVAGATLLLITAIYYQLIYFIALEIILISGHSAILFGIGPILQLALPVLLSLQLLSFYYFSGQLNNLFIFAGIGGIAFHSIGFAYQSQFIFFCGSSMIAIYAFYASQKSKPALLWGILNALFSCFAMIKLFS